MSDIIRRGYYYNSSTQSIPVGDNLLHHFQKINSKHPDFKLIDVRYIQSGFLVFEQYIPFSSMDRYEEYGEPVKFNPETETYSISFEVSDSKEEIIEKFKKAEVEVKIEDIPELPNINLNEGTSKEEIEKIPEVVLTVEEVQSMAIEEAVENIVENIEEKVEENPTIENVVEEVVKPKRTRKPKTPKIEG